MRLKSTIEILNREIGFIPEYLYHGRVGNPTSIEKFSHEITIYPNVDVINGIDFWKKRGRPHLDCCFHGFYLTPCEALARKWAMTKVPRKGQTYQILKFRTNQNELQKLSYRNLIVPDSDWANHVFRNRAKLINRNEFDFVYSYIADNIMTNIESKIASGIYINNPRQFHLDILNNYHQSFINDYYGSRRFNSDKIIRSCNLHKYKNYQFCVSSQAALNQIELVDIINLPEDIQVPDNTKIEEHLSEYQGFVPEKVIRHIREVSRNVNNP